jgi:predicted O-linked N-acetylglucosamine transferase (SPINDLY family)
MPEAVAKARAGPRPADKPFTFGSFNAVSKLNPGLLAAWAEILRAAPASRLILKAASFDDPGVRETTIRKFEASGVAGDRVTILPPTASRQAHLAAYADIDLALDTFPYSGTTTTCEAAAISVPTLTLRDNRHAGRVGATINHALGQSHLIAETVPDYVATAVKLATESATGRHDVHMVRDRLLASPLCDANRLATSFTTTIRKLCD